MEVSEGRGDTGALLHRSILPFPKSDKNKSEKGYVPERAHAEQHGTEPRVWYGGVTPWDPVRLTSPQ